LNNGAREVVIRRYIYEDLAMGHIRVIYALGRKHDFVFGATILDVM
jgi:hypothetical protein